MAGEKRGVVDIIIILIFCVASCKNNQAATIEHLHLEKRLELELMAFLNNYKSLVL